MTILDDRLTNVKRQDNGCLEWQGSIDSNGYGRIGHNLRAHRLAWSIANDSGIPSGMLVCHRCDNPRCVEPDHLFLGTIADNNRDRHLKGRSKNLFPVGDKHPARLRRGQRHWAAKLTDRDVLEIRLRSESGETQRAIAADMGVHSATVSRISRGIWRTEVPS